MRLRYAPFNKENTMDDIIATWGWRISRQGLTQEEFCNKVVVNFHTFRSIVRVGSTTKKKFDKIEGGLRDMEA